MVGDGEPIGAAVPETPECAGAFPRLSAGQIERLRELGHVRDVDPGEVLFRVGDKSTGLILPNPSDYLRRPVARAWSAH
jgi:hypothetical protein